MATDLRALFVDYGGVLTTPLSATIPSWLAAEGIDPTRFRELMRGWLVSGADPNIAHDLEIGRITAAEFERRFAAELVRADGTSPVAAGLLTRMFAGFRPEDVMVGVVRRAKASGLRTGLLSNSWGNDYPRAEWDRLFDAVVISGEVGLRKPDPAIYALAAERIGVPAEATVFVDDLSHNVRAAAAAGMVGVHHTDPDRTIEELEVLFDRPLR